MQDFIGLAHHLADEARKIIRPYFRTDVDIDHKGDESPVTIADRAVEEHLRSIIEEKRPEDGIIGEEFGIKDSQNQYDWVLDPIDGTKSFIAGRPSFGTLIALCENDVPILGIIDQPILNERWVGVKGQQTLFSRHAGKPKDAIFNSKPAQTRKCSALQNARLCSTSPNWIPDHWKKLRDQSDFLIWGGDCYSYGLIATGGIDAVIETGLSPYDYAALPPIIEGAGGHMCDWNGNPLTTKSDGRVLAMGYIALKDQILKIVNS